MKILNNAAIRHIHCMGIGGIGVSGLAELLLAKGYVVTGSDMTNNPLIDRLVTLGAKVTIGHKAENIGDADALVYTSMINPNNPEFLAAKKRGIVMMRRGELLAEFMEEKECLVVAGTHGKTTTTSLIAHLLLKQGWDPTYMIGGVINNLEAPAHLGTGRYFVAESDESDGSFLHLTPKIAVVTNIDNDHLEYYGGNFETLKKAFLQFLNQITKQGCAILNWDDPMVREVAAQYSGRVIKTGFHADADVRAEQCQQEGLFSKFKVKRGNQHLQINLSLPGIHNINNALGVIALAQLIGVADDILLNALAHFPGVRRRFYSHGEVNIKNGKILVFDDYGHHPREIKATIEAVRGAWPERRFVMVFQPHRYTRTRDLMAEFASVLSLPDQVVLLEVYNAGENAIPGVNGATLCEAIVRIGHSKPIFVANIEDLPKILKQVLQPNDVVFFQGAGNVASLAKTISQQLV